MPFLAVALRVLSGSGKFLSLLWTIVTSRVGLPILVFLVTYPYAHHKGVVEERARNEIAYAAAVIEQQKIDAAARKQIEKDVRIRLDTSQARERMLQTQVEKYVEELRKRPPSATCLATDRDVEWLSGLSPSYKTPRKGPSAR